MTERLGLIAGNGRFPLLFAQQAKNQGKNLVAVCIRQDTSGSINKLVDKSYWINVGELKKLIDIFKKEKIDKVVMAGQISPYLLFKMRSKFDDELKSLLKSIKDKRADSIFNAVAQKLSSSGIELIDSTLFLKDLMPNQGVLTKREPTNQEKEDIRLGFKTAKHLGSIDIGQTVVVKDGAILAVEAFEGTDAAILRGAILGGSGVVVAKASKPTQDMRFDVPLVGLRTINRIIKVKAACLAIEANKTLILDKQECINLANKRNISIVAV